jgi:hypothetical protein
MCFVFIWEQSATYATYTINWLLFITKLKSVYCAVRTGSLNTAVCLSSLKGQCMSMTNTVSSTARFKRSKNCQSLKFQTLQGVRNPLRSTLTNWNNYHVPLATRQLPSLSPSNQSYLPSSAIAPTLLSHWPDVLIIRHSCTCPTCQSGQPLSTHLIKKKILDGNINNYSTLKGYSVITHKRSEKAYSGELQ